MFLWIEKYSALLLKSLSTTIELLLICSSLGFLLAICVAFARISTKPHLRLPAYLFTTIIMGTPMLVQLYVFYYGVGSLLASSPHIRGSFLWPYLREGFWYAALMLTLSVGAYTGELLRGGLLAVPKGELEAAHAVGMTRFQVVRSIWLPRTVIMLLPMLAGSMVGFMKATALVSTVAVMDILGAANLIRSLTFHTYEPLLVAALFYFLMTMLIEWGFRKLENRYPNRTKI